jgi:phosphoglycolate phosphatase
MSLSGATLSSASLAGATLAFDLDGTLVETAPDLIGALNTVLGERGLPPLPVEAARALVGRGARFLIEHGFQCAGEPLDEAEIGGLTTRFIAVYLGRIASESRPYPGLVEALGALSAAGVKLVVCTNKRTDLSLALLDALELTDRFGAVIGADLAPKPKPDASHFLAAVEAVGGDPRRAIMVGDSHNDVAAARAAGAPCIVVTFGYTETPAAELGGDRLIDSFDQLIGAATELLAGLPVRNPSAIGSPSRRTDA